MIEICMLASGSSGNAVYVASESTRLLVDAGLSGRRLAAALNEIGVDPSGLDAILVSHDHTDHISGAGIMARRYCLPVYATAGTFAAARAKLGRLPGDLTRVMIPGRPFRLRDLEIITFSLPHDAADPVGFLFRNKGLTAALVTDLGDVPAPLLPLLQRAHCLILEANHDEEMLINGTYPWQLKQRILGAGGHLSNRTAARTLARLLCPHTRHVVLAHLSAENNRPSLAFDTVAAHLEEAGHHPGRSFLLQVAERHRPSCHLRLT